jgi:hypothetical protein
MHTRTHHVDPTQPIAPAVAAAVPGAAAAAQAGPAALGSTAATPRK